MTKTSEKEKKELNNLDSIIDKIPENEREDAIEIIKAKKAQAILDEEKAKLKKLNKCATPKCKGKLEGFDVNKFLMKGRKSYRLECNKCHRLHRVLVIYQDEPGLCSGELSVTPLEFAWRTNHPSKMTDDQLTVWLDDEDKKVIDNKSNYIKRDDQLVIRSLAMINRKLSKVKK
jgi:hypothetical protein